MSKPSRAISGFKTKTDLAYEALREDILAGRYPPGARIVIDQLAVELGTSKVPVREAVVRLAGEGWLQLKSHVGAVVPVLSPEEIHETSLIRAVVEGAAVRLSVDRVTAPLLQKLRQLMQRMDEAARAGGKNYPDLNMEFHSVAFEPCPYPNLRALALSLVEKTWRLRTVRFLPEYLSESQREHGALLQAIEGRDGAAAEAITRHHVENAGRLLWQFAVEQRQGPRSRGHEKLQSGGR